MRKGFTLIELLSVIVILSIIALIAVPIVINIINDVKTNSDKNAVKLYLDTVEKSIVRKNLKEKFNPEKCDILDDGNLECNDIILEVETKGKKPTEGVLHIRNGKVILGENIYLNGNYYQVDINKAMTKEELQIAYFKEYNGNDSFLGFNKENIVSFSRNTTLTKAEVLAKTGVQLISSTEEDDYKSSKEIYGWVEDNNFYWWSEANKVYFHPKTVSAFRSFPSIVSIDLTDTDTSKVENFAFWFAYDSELVTLKSTINTSGLKYSTAEVSSFYYMFYRCTKLLKVDTSEFYTKNATRMTLMFFGCKSLVELDVSNFDTSNAISISGMFHSCHKLKKLDVSNFNTSNVKYMTQMFYECKNLKELDVSNFNTSKVEKMTSMFYGCESLTSIDIENFDTSNVKLMNYMFCYNTALKTIVLGENFITNNVTDMSNMFRGNTNLIVIYVKHDFVLNDNLVSDTMFADNTKLVGGYDTSYRTSYNSSYVDSTYARISNENQSGYFTYYDSINDIRYNITYDLNGGDVYNKDYYYKGFDYTLENPTKPGYVFIGWTGSNGITPQEIVSITNTSRENKSYTANYVKADKFEIVGPCKFNGENSNITGDNCKLVTSDGSTVSYTNKKYINTGIQLFNTNNSDKDFKISFKIDSVDSYTNQSTLVSSMNEASSPWPGFVFRINASTNKFQLRGGYNGNSNWEFPYTIQNVTIERKNKILYYTIDNGNSVSIIDFNNLLNIFDYPLTFGVSLNASKTPQRYFKGTLSNIVVELEN